MALHNRYHYFFSSDKLALMLLITRTCDKPYMAKSKQFHFYASQLSWY